MQATAVHCFTTISTSGILRELRNDCLVSEAFDTSEPLPHPTAMQFSALWDTGASNTVITQKVVDQCGLKPIGLTETHGVGGAHNTEVYLINIVLANKVMFRGLQVIRGDLLQIDLLIGMDIIAAGDFAVTNAGGKTMFSYRFPSSGHIDFVQQLNHDKLKNNPRLHHGPGKRSKGKRK